MRVVLTQEVPSVGGPGDVIDVSDGYARNFLIPRRFAVQATKGSLKQVQQIRKGQEVREIRDRERAEEIGRELAALAVRVSAKAGEAGRLFGQVTHQAVADAVAKAGGPKVDRRRLHFDEPIKSLGVHRVRLRLHPEVEAEFSVEVVSA